MWPGSRHAFRHRTALAWLLAVAEGLLAESAHGEPAIAAKSAALPAAEQLDARWSAAIQPWRFRAEGDGFAVPLPDRHRALLTLHAPLQRHVLQELRRFAVPHAALVALEVSSGRILAYVSHSQEDEPSPFDRVRANEVPAASVFKLVTTAALLEAGVSPDESTCYHGGTRSIEADNLRDNMRRDGQCASLTEALGGSLNVVFGKLALRYLDAPRLLRQAHALGFGKPLPSDIASQAGEAQIDAEPLALARAAAGFSREVTLSPLHGALLTAAIANGGRMPTAQLVEQVVDDQGEVVYRAPTVAKARRVLRQRSAKRLATMMQATVSAGTSRSAFYDEQGRPYLGAIGVAGKTGSLADAQHRFDYSWWVGFAPVDRPRIALAVLLLNEPRWRIKASYLAREALRVYLRTPGGQAPSRGREPSHSQARGALPPVALRPARHSASAASQQSTDRAIGALDEARCLATLERSGVAYRPADRHLAPQVQTPVHLVGALRGIDFDFRGRDPIHQVFDCRLLVALWHWAETLRRAEVTRVVHFSALRPNAQVNGSGRSSGHARGLAIDVGWLERKRGLPLRVLDSWEERQHGGAPCDLYADETADNRLLRQLVCEAVHTDLFQVMLTPHHDRSHADHVHLEVVPDVGWSYVR